MNGPISIVIDTALCFILMLPVLSTANIDKVKVYDHVLTTSNLDELTSFVSDYLTWKQRPGFDRMGVELLNQDTIWHSNSHQDVAFSELDSWKSLKQLMNSHINLYNDLTGSSDGRLWPVGVQGRVLFRGDFPQLQKSDNLSVCTLFLFICHKWQKNSYGEMKLFNKNGVYLESIYPRNGRVVVVPAALNYIIKPPSMNTEQSLMVISLGLSSNNKTLLVSKPPPDFNDLKFTLPPRKDSWQISMHVTKEFQAHDNKKIVIFDNIFTETEQRDFFEKIEQGIYHFSPPSHDSEDNVLWILGLDVSNLLQSDLWRVLNKAIAAATGIHGYHPYDVSCNNIQTWHHPKIHKDCRDDEDDYTVLVYLTPNWTDSYYGETVFYNGDEICAVVRPKFGRLVIFHGAIWHSARPPSPLFRGPRYTFAVKCAPTKELAMRKSLILSCERLFSVDEEMVGSAKAEEIRHFTKMLSDGLGEHEEMEKLAMKYEKELDELEQ